MIGENGDIPDKIYRCVKEKIYKCAEINVKCD